MDKELIKTLLSRVKFCIARKVVVNFNSGQYIPSALQLRHNGKDFYYTVILDDYNRHDSSITVGLNDVDWPSSGGGYYICES